MQRPSAVLRIPTAEFLGSKALQSSQKTESLHFTHSSEQETSLQTIDAPSLTGSLPAEHLSLHFESVSMTKVGRRQEVHFRAELV